MNLQHLSLLAALLSPLAALGQTGTVPPATQTAPAAPLPDSPDATTPPALQPTGPTAVIDTSMGRLTCRLYSKEAPETVANFTGLATGSKEWTDPTTHQKVRGKPFYDGLTFHRVIPNFMIQGGDPLGDGTGDPGYLFADEFNPNLNFDVPGRLAMANSGPNTNGSQFFITEATPTHLNGHHTIFGQCDDSSLLIVKSIARVETGPENKPVTPVVIQHVTIVQPGAALPPPPPAASPSTPQ
jgi:peptidyl-prolyl cis-trans isomerase A (cyclophilin A)